MIADQRRKRLTDAMQESGLDVLLVYGNAWQGDYLRYATDFGILEGQALAITPLDRTFHIVGRAFTVRMLPRGLSGKSVGDYIDDVPTGYWEWFRKDGTMMRSGHFEDGKQAGEWTTYDQEGQVYKVTKMKSKTM